jgi:hypothetical protein
MSANGHPYERQFHWEPFLVSRPETECLKQYVTTYKNNAVAVETEDADWLERVSCPDKGSLFDKRFKTKEKTSPVEMTNLDVGQRHIFNGRTEQRSMTCTRAAR